MMAIKNGNQTEIEKALLNPTYPRTIRIVMNRGLSSKSVEFSSYTWYSLFLILFVYFYLNVRYYCYYYDRYRISKFLSISFDSFSLFCSVRVQWTSSLMLSSKRLNLD